MMRTSHGRLANAVRRPIGDLGGITLLMVVFALVGSSAASGQESASAPPQQQGPLGPQPPNPDQPLTPGEVQRLFDAYAVVQAQEQLKLSDEQYGPFISKLKVLQDARRQHQQRRMRLIQDMARLTRPQEPPVDEATLKARLDALQQEDADAQVIIRKAYDAVEQLLDVRQRVRFRVFEDQMERRKLDLLLRARQQRRQSRLPNS
jgi:hypothetical protein